MEKIVKIIKIILGIILCGIFLSNILMHLFVLFWEKIEYEKKVKNRDLETEYIPMIAEASLPEIIPCGEKRQYRLRFATNWEIESLGDGIVLIKDINKPDGIISRGDNEGIIDFSGNIIIPVENRVFLDNDIIEVSYISYGSGGYHYYDKSGELLYSLTDTSVRNYSYYNMAEPVYTDRNGWLIPTERFYDDDGKFLYTKITYDTSSPESGCIYRDKYGFVTVPINDGEERYLCIQQNNYPIMFDTVENKVCFPLDKDFSVETDSDGNFHGNDEKPRYQRIYWYCPDLNIALVHLNGWYCWIDAQENIIIKLNGNLRFDGGQYGYFNAQYHHYDSLGSIYQNKDPEYYEYLDIEWFHGEYCAVPHREGLGIVSAAGEIKADYKYEEACYMYDGLWFMRDGDDWFVFDPAADTEPFLTDFPRKKLRFFERGFTCSDGKATYIYEMEYI